MGMSAGSRVAGVRPPRLKPGDKIGVISPAGSVEPSTLEPGLRRLESSGFRVRLSPHLYNKIGYLAGRDDSRLHDLHTMFQDPEIGAVFCTRGGYGSLRLLDRISFHLIGENPKVIVGHSDVTALLMAVYNKTGLVTFHGPMLQGIDSKDERNWDALMALICSGRPATFDLKGLTVLVPGKAQGPLIGGNLSIICHLAGTPYLPSPEGSILFVEDKGEHLYRIDRMLTHLLLSGFLNGLAGVVAGDFQDCGGREAIEGVFMDRIGSLGIPVVTGLPIGHGVLNLTVPIGISALLDTDDMVLATGSGCVV